MIRKLFVLITMFIVLIPVSVSANVICNDGTISPSCASCGRGCCSHHGGCSSRYTSTSNNTSSSSSKTNSDTYSSSNGTVIRNIKDSSNTSRESDSSSFVEGLILIGVIAAGVHGAKKRK